MSKTKNDIITLAMRDIGVLSIDEEPLADDAKYAGDILDSEFLRIQPVHGFTWTWDTDTVPDELYSPLATYLASFLTAYSVPLPNRRQALAMIRAHEFPDDRTDRADLDKDGVLSDDEKAAATYTAFF